jgi:hypothetical protein
MKGKVKGIYGKNMECRHKSKEGKRNVKENEENA